MCVEPRSPIQIRARPRVKRAGSLRIKSQALRWRLRRIDQPKAVIHAAIGPRALLDEKFATLTRGIVEPQSAKRISAAIDRMEHMTDIGEFTRLLAG